MSNTAQEILDAVGGPGNITHFTHCATRLRFELRHASVSLSTTEASLSSKRSLVAQCVKLMMFSGPPTAARIASGAEVVVVIEGLSWAAELPRDGT